MKMKICLFQKFFYWKKKDSHTSLRSQFSVFVFWRRHVLLACVKLYVGPWLASKPGVMSQILPVCTCVKLRFKVSKRSSLRGLMCKTTSSVKLCTSILQ